MNRLRACFVWTLAGCLCSSTALADGVMRDGQGAVAAGRGGTNLAFADNGAILLDNPAGMTNVASNGLLDFSLDNLMVMAEYSDQENHTDSDLAVYPLGYFAVMQKAFDGVLAYGIGVFAPAGFGANYDMINTGIDPGRVNYEYMSFGALVRVLPAVGVQVTDRLSVGGTLGVAASHTELEGPLHIQTGLFAGTPTLLDMQATGAALSWSLGVQYRLSDRTTVGAAYNSENRFNLDGSANVTVAGLGSSDFDLDARLEWPQTVGVGLQHQLSVDRRMGLDVIWYDWSGSFDSLDMTMSNASNPAFAFLGNEVSDSLSLNWRDSVSVRVGLEQLLPWCSVGRAGYVYHRNPVPDGTLTPFIPGIMEHTISFGWGKRWADHSFNVAYAYMFGPSQEVGVSDLAGGDFNDSRVDASAHFVMLNFTKWW
ncbi:MAG: outer membrane protein transport protein [Planctomycetes bacterium]|nr:outer membrane protein transport protein [Planctomycetota bacterium]